VRKAAYFEPFSGIAGDMVVGALLDAGASFEVVKAAVAAIPVEGIEVRVRPVAKGALACTKFEVRVHGEIEGPVGEGHGHDHPHDHHHHGHDHGHHAPAPSRGKRRAGGHAAHRGMPEIRALLGKARLDPAVRDAALRVFEKLAAAEAKVHGSTPDAVAFHEVGALDALADIVAAAAALDALGIQEIYCGPVRTGAGMVDIAHGRVPVPAPGTLELLRGFDLRLEQGRGELVTPTGAAILAALARPHPPAEGTAERVGYGAGTKDGDAVPNCLRVTVGRVPDPHGAAAVHELAANLDDATPQVLARAAERLLEAGALDAWIEPALMKKGRPGQVLRALAEEGAVAAVEDAMFAETGTLGVRRHRVERRVCERVLVPVETPHGTVRVKVGSRGGVATTAAPEYEDCRSIAAATGVPVREVMDAARAAWRARAAAAAGPPARPGDPPPPARRAPARGGRGPRGRR
jgi:uncharacterized protein (TIGR00299 family) protein